MCIICVAFCGRILEFSFICFGKKLHQSNYQRNLTFKDCSLSVHRQVTCHLLLHLHPYCEPFFQLLSRGLISRFLSPIVLSTSLWEVAHFLGN